MNLNKKTEEELKTEAVKYLKHGRPDWDLPHTLAVVHYMKKLMHKKNGDGRILIPAAYLHDIGYSQVVKEGENYQELLKHKKAHMIEGAKLSRNILRKLDFPQDEIEKIAALVKRHDDKSNINTLNEQLIFEADSLGMIDRQMAGQGVLKNNKDFMDFIEYFKRSRLPLFKTEYAKNKVQEILSRYE